MSKKLKPKLDSSFSSAEASPGFLLWKAANLLQKSHVTVLKPLNLTPAQFSIMTCLVYLSGKGNVTSANISKHAGLDKMMISDLVKTLKKKNLITTSSNPADGRSFLIEPTKLGVKTTNQAVRAIEEVDEVFFQSERDKENLLNTLLNLVIANNE
ncbi:MAG: MarR family transcriptional regulator [Bdellovibrionota bacterium]|nr:MarR family transcriptional regulator [Bdellovibrionota bacterium]